MEGTRRQDHLFEEQDEEKVQICWYAGHDGQTGSGAIKDTLNNSALSGAINERASALKNDVYTILLEVRS